MTDLVITQAFKSWANLVRPFASSNAMDQILNKVLGEDRKKFTVYPPNNQVFRCFKECNYQDFKVMIVNTEPYTSGAANGLAYAIDPSWPGKLPHELKNLVTELREEYPETIIDYSLSSWPKQGILLYNLALTVLEAHKGSHSDIWAPFSQFLFKELSDKNTGIIYILLGPKAGSYAKFINEDTNYIFRHASPSQETFTARNAGFFESQVFLDINVIHKKLYGYEIIF